MDPFNGVAAIVTAMAALVAAVTALVTAIASLKKSIATDGKVNGRLQELLNAIRASAKAEAAHALEVRKAIDLPPGGPSDGPKPKP